MTFLFYAEVYITTGNNTTNTPFKALIQQLVILSSPNFAASFTGFHLIHILPRFKNRTAFKATVPIAILS